MIILLVWVITVLITIIIVDTTVEYSLHRSLSKKYAKKEHCNLQHLTYKSFTRYASYCPGKWSTENIYFENCFISYDKSIVIVANTVRIDNTYYIFSFFDYFRVMNYVNKHLIRR